MTTQQQLEKLIKSQPTSDFYQSLQKQLTEKGHLSEKQLATIESSLEKLEKAKEYKIKCKIILEKAPETFKSDFVKSVLENITKYKSVSDKQAASIDNIILKFEM